MTEKDIILAIAKSLGIKPKADHEWEGKDDNRWFECQNCGVSHSWRDYLNKDVPSGPCSNWKEEEDRYEQMRDILTSKLSCVQGEQFIKHLWKLVARYDTDVYTPDAAYLLVLANIYQLREAYVKTIGLWVEQEKFQTE